MFGLDEDDASPGLLFGETEENLEVGELFGGATPIQAARSEEPTEVVGPAAQQPEPRPQQQPPPSQETPQRPGYPPQQAYPGYPPQHQGYPPQQPGYPPPQRGYPGYPPQQQGYPPPPQGYPAYPPQQQGYPPQQQGYPPQQQGYPPQQQGYPPQQQGYPPPQQGYPPQRGQPPQGYPPQGSYPPQAGYPPPQNVETNSDFEGFDDPLPAGPAGFRLVALEGLPGQSDFVLPGGKVYLVGRDREADVKILSTSVSRRQARIDATGSRPVLIDLGSANGTKVNGNPVDRHPLREGDLIKMGKVVLRFQDA